MKTLFIDSSRKSLSIAVSNGDKLLFTSNVNSYSKHSNFLMNEIKSILNKSDFTVYDLDSVVILNGPGSFTGVRVGVTIAKTICWTLSKKLYQLNNLEALRVGVNNDIVISVIPDKLDNSYVGIYEEQKVIEDYLSIDSELFNIENKNITIVSTAENDFASSLKEKLSVNNNVDINIIRDYNYIDVIKYAMSKKDINPHLAEPIYLKKIDAEKNKNVN